MTAKQFHWQRDFIDKAGRLRFIHYAGHLAISVGENGYARVEVKPTPSTIRRLEALADRGYGSRETEQVGGVIYRSPKDFRAAVFETQKKMIGWKLKAIAHRWGLKRA
jgi:hypothetical protein